MRPGSKHVTISHVCGHNYIQTYSKNLFEFAGHTVMNLPDPKMPWPVLPYPTRVRNSGKRTSAGATWLAFHTQKKQKSMADGILSVSQSFVQSKKHYETVTESCSVYKRRWYILTIFSLIAGVQAAAWNTWGPITGSAEDVFGWSDGTIALLENWGPIAYILSFLFFSWLMDVKGMLGYLWGRNTELWWCIISIKRAIPWRASVRFTCSASSVSSLECTICTD